MKLVFDAYVETCFNRLLNAIRKHPHFPSLSEDHVKLLALFFTTGAFIADNDTDSFDEFLKNLNKYLK